MRSSFGRRARIWLRIERPPTPESKMPIALSSIAGRVLLAYRFGQAAENNNIAVSHVKVTMHPTMGEVDQSGEGSISSRKQKGAAVCAAP
jgi:hypothetical protein